MQIAPTTRERCAPLAHTAALMAALPFDMAREFYAKLVQMKVVEHSLLGSAKFERDLNQMEKLTLGPWARQV